VSRLRRDHDAASNARLRRRDRDHVRRRQAGEGEQRDDRVCIRPPALTEAREGGRVDAKRVRCPPAREARNGARRVDSRVDPLEVDTWPRRAFGRHSGLLGGFGSFGISLAGVAVSFEITLRMRREGSS
jgi:hypothetical protein